MPSKAGDLILMIKNIVIRFLRRNEFESNALRHLYRKWYGVDVGLYSYGCFDFSRIPRGTKVGRYCSFAPTCSIFPRNHGLDYLALHPYLYNSVLGLVAGDTISNKPCVIEDDVWIGHNATITANVRTVGRGAVIAAGSVVTRDVPRYAIVAGNPARTLKYRFSQETISCVEASEWWLLDKSALAKLIRSNPEMIFSPEKYFEKN